MQRVFEALASQPRRKILALLAHTELSAGEIASRFSMTKPSISQHLAILEAAGLVVGEKRGQFVFYRQISENLVNTLHGFVQEVCPVSRPTQEAKAGPAAARVAARSAARSPSIRTRPDMAVADPVAAPAATSATADATTGLAFHIASVTVSPNPSTRLFCTTTVARCWRALTRRAPSLTGVMSP